MSVPYETAAYEPPDSHESPEEHLARLLGRALNSFELPDETIRRLDCALAHDGSLHSAHHSAGLELHNALTFNPDDYWGMGVARTELGTNDQELLLESYYKFQMTEKLTMTVHLTHVTEEPVDAEETSYFVPGLRVQASF